MDKRVEVFEYMCGDEVSTRMYYSEGCDVTFENFTDDPVDRAFGVADSPVPEKDFYKFLEDRCFPRTRHDVQRVLKSLGLGYYDPYLIVKKTHGMMFDDCYWIRFEGEEGIKYKELRESFGI